MPSKYNVRNAKNGDVDQWKGCSANLGPRCANCHVISLEMFACDFTAGGHTCNMVLCDSCAAPQGNDLHMCPAHAGMKTDIRE